MRDIVHELRQTWGIPINDEGLRKRAAEEILNLRLENEYLLKALEEAQNQLLKRST